MVNVACIAACGGTSAYWAVKLNKQKYKRRLKKKKKKRMAKKK
jgi:transposase